MFEPVIDLPRLQPLIDALEQARRDIEALDVPPALERALQRVTEARGAHMSTRIEGNPMTEEEVRAEFARATPGTSRAELENRDYRDAARFARQVANDFDADIDGGLIRGLHYLVSRNTDTHGTAGQYRTEANVIRDSRTQTIIYQPPPPLEVPGLMSDLIAWLRAHRRDTHPGILAAISHAELVKIHPFDDGNGRTARALTKYFFERHGWHLRGLVTPEQVFGEDTDGYYAGLRELGPRYLGPRVDLTEWVRWLVGGFVRRLGEVAEFAREFEFWKEVDAPLLERQGLPARTAAALTAVALDGSVTRGAYAREARISPAAAAGDLGRLVSAGWLQRSGLGRNSRYVPGPRFPAPRPPR
jgi:Fic family protein